MPRTAVRKCKHKHLPEINPMFAASVSNIILCSVRVHRQIQKQNKTSLFKLSWRARRVDRRYALAHTVDLYSVHCSYTHISSVHSARSCEIDAFLWNRCERRHSDNYELLAESSRTQLIYPRPLWLCSWHTQNVSILFLLLRSTWSRGPMLLQSAHSPTGEQHIRLWRLSWRVWHRVKGTVYLELLWSIRSHNRLFLLTQTSTGRQSGLFYIFKFELRGIIGNCQ